MPHLTQHLWASILHELFCTYKQNHLNKQIQFKQTMHSTYMYMYVNVGYAYKDLTNYNYSACVAPAKTSTPGERYYYKLSLLACGIASTMDPTSPSSGSGDCHQRRLCTLTVQSRACFKGKGGGVKRGALPLPPCWLSPSTPLGDSYSTCMTPGP